MTFFTFSIRATAAITLTHELRYDFIGSGNRNGTVITTNATTNALLYLNLSANAPKMKVIDFFAGILKTFNLVCVGTGLNQYELAPLDTWYGQGRILDISKHVEIDSIGVQRMPLYNKIGFNFQPSESVLKQTILYKHIIVSTEIFCINTIMMEANMLLNFHLKIYYNKNSREQICKSVTA